MAEALAFLKKRGILLAIASKNDATFIEGVWDRMMGGRLRLEDFACRMIDWSPKAENVAKILEFTRILPRNAVFIDDNPAERKRVRDALPAVAVPELPEDPSDWLAVLQAAGYFEQTSFSKEDQLRASYYKANALRAAQLEKIGNHDDYLRSLVMTLSIAPFDAPGRKRIAQLILRADPVAPLPGHGEGNIPRTSAARLPLLNLSSIWSIKIPFAKKSAGASDACPARVASPVPLHRARPDPCARRPDLRAATGRLGRQCHQDRCAAGGRRRGDGRPAPRF